MARIRQARPADREGISEAHVASIRGVSPGAYDEAALGIWATGAASVTYSIDDPETVVVVAERAGEIAGFAEASVGASELDKLYVQPAYQDRGIARSLSEAIDRRLRDRGVESVVVEASVNAAPFYERVGYERVGTHRKTVAAGGESVAMEMVDMEKQL